MILIGLILCPLLALAQENPLGLPTSLADSPQEKVPFPPASLADPQDKPPPPPTDEPFLKTLIKQISLGGQIRLRAEYRNFTSYNNTAAANLSDEVFLTRIRLNLKFSVTDDITVFVQPQDQRQWGQEQAVLADERNLDLHQGWIEIRNIFGEPLSFKGGRMELSYGDQRLVSPLDWSNIGRAWDGAKIRYAPKDFWIEGFYTVIRDPIAAPPPVFGPLPPAAAGAAEDQDFMGVYFSYVAIPDHEFDLYGFFRRIRDGSARSEGAVPGDQFDRTLGARIKGGGAGFDYTLEGMSQSGKVSTDRELAYAYAATLGYTFDMPWRPRLGVEYTFASGDRNLGDGKQNTFDPLYPFGHYYQGFIDQFAFKNGKDLAVYLKVQPTDALSLHADFHNFWLANDDAPWFNAAGGQIRPGAASGVASPHVGEELDLHARLQAGQFIKFWAGWSHFFPGTYVHETATVGPHTAMNWFFLQMTVDF
jgi:hypothetical protein